jgi:hypothetical protein
VLETGFSFHGRFVEPRIGVNVRPAVPPLYAEISLVGTLGRGSDVYRLIVFVAEIKVTAEAAKRTHRVRTRELEISPRADQPLGPNGAYGTDVRALPAEFAVKRPRKIGGYLGQHSTIDETEFLLALDFVADPHAHAASYTEVHVVTDEVRIVVHVKVTGFTGERQISHTIFMHEILKPAIAGCVAGRAQQGVRSQQ